MTDKLTSIRFNPELLPQVEAFAKLEGLTFHGAVIMLIRRGLNPKSPRR